MSGPTPSFRIAGAYFESCNCDAICPCRRVGGRPGGNSTYGVCFGVLSWRIDEGHVDEISLAGLNAALVLRYDDHERGSPWRFNLHVDDRGDEQQQTALADLFTGKLGGPAILGLPWVRKPSKLLELKASRIEIDHADGGYEVWIADTVEMRASRPVETAEVVSCIVPGHDHPGTELYADMLAVSDGPFEWELTGRCAFVSDFDYRSDSYVAFEFKLPELGEGLTEGEVARWLVAEGDEIAEGAPLVEIQTDKATVEIPSPAAGTILRILVPDGHLAPVGAVLVVIGDEGEQLLRSVGHAPGGAVEPDADQEPELSVVPSEPVAAVRATPAARELAQRLGVDLATVGGSGPDSRVTEDDVRAASPSHPIREGRREAVRGIRRLIVEHLTTSHREIPAVTFVEECDFTGIDHTMLVPRVLKATAAALAEFPELNARLEGDEIVYLDRYDLGLAVQTAMGLVVPVVRGCDAATAEELLAEIVRLAESARAGTLKPEEVRGSTFTVTSAGKLGGIVVTPLVNYPEVAILGLHRIAPRPVVRDGEVVIREMGNVSVTFDHRVVDGARAAAFCLDVIVRLEAG